MIKNISATGKYIQVSGSAGSTFVGNNSGSQGVGNMRYNTITQNIEIYDGHDWVLLNTGFMSIGLSGEAEALLDWAREKRDQEMRLKEIAKTNPTVRDLMDQIKEKQEQLEIVDILSNGLEKL